ncbi:MAG: DNA-binding transcriptional MerR regulator [Candidatus Azotimanducaceae bacterium]|jgi:DNA-binding transcriptional MerR regulator
MYMGDSQTYKISELAKEFDVTTRAIRFYEDKGMLTPTRQGLTRIYNAADRTKLKLILRGKRLGLTLDESFDIIDMYSPGKSNADQLQTLIRKIQERRLRLEQQMQDLEIMVLDLQDYEQRCSKSLQDITTEKTSLHGSAQLSGPLHNNQLIK